MKYIDANGNKQDFAGTFVYDEKTNTYSGIVTKTEKIVTKYDLQYHNAVEGVEGYSSYYSYVNSDNKIVKYPGFIKQDKNGNSYFTYTSVEKIELIYHPATSESKTYYTYIIDNSEYIWTNPVKCRNKEYYGMK